MDQEVRPVVHVKHDGIPGTDQLLDHAFENEPDITGMQLDQGSEAAAAIDGQFLDTPNRSSTARSRRHRSRRPRAKCWPVALQAADRTAQEVEA
jgi:hypothetical protein